MDKLVIHGKCCLGGAVAPQGNKNEALPVLAACLLTRDSVVLRNVPDIGDVRSMMDIMMTLGATFERLSKNDWRVNCENIETAELDMQKCKSLRAAILLAGPLLSRFQHVLLPPPGGDVIGRRRLDDHFSAFKALGAQVGEVDRQYFFKRTELRGTDFFFEEQSVTATENALMAAVCAHGQTILRNAACEPHVQGLAKLLVKMGADIQGIGSNTLTITGVTELGGAEHTIGPDLLEIGGYMVMAAVTNSAITIQGVVPDEIRVIHSTYKKLGFEYSLDADQLRLPAGQYLQVQPDFGGDIPKIDDGTWPAFPTDLMSMMIVAATQAKGTALFFEKMYDGRMFFVDHLIGMGAQIVLCDPHRVVVVGPSQLYGTTLQSPDIRAGMSLVIAAMCAQGDSTIYNIKQIDRGYENLEGKLQALGADIQRISDS